jgi:nitroreductase
MQLLKCPADATPELRAQVQEAGRTKFLSKPAVVVVSCLQQGDETRRREDFAATCCAVQNILLAAWAEGLGMQWSTNVLISDPWTYETLGIDPEQETIIGFLYIGYPAETPTVQRKPLDEVIRRTP